MVGTLDWKRSEQWRYRPGPFLSVTEMSPTLVGEPTGKTPCPFDVTPEARINLQIVI